MRPLPDPQTLARLVSNVTSSLVGVSFRPVESVQLTEGEWTTALLSINGARPLTIGLASERASSTALSAAIFSCVPDKVDQTMREDSLRELTNMTAGLVKSTLGLDALLGLPRIAPGATVPRERPVQSVLLQADRLGLLLWVSEGHV